MSSFASFKESFSSNMSTLKRRLSLGEYEEGIGADGKPVDSGSCGQTGTAAGGQPQNTAATAGSRPLTGPMTISAPTSPQRSGPGSSVAEITKGWFTQKMDAAWSGSAQQREKCKILLVIDDMQTDWSKYFRAKKLFGEFDIRVEQAEFADVNLASYSDGAAIVNIAVQRGGSRLIRTFKVDFVLVRQHVRDAGKDFRNFLLGLSFASVPCLNSTTALFNFADKAWLFSHLLQIRRKVGAENFPVIDAVFYPSYKEMMNAFIDRSDPKGVTLMQPSFPIVVKIGHAHSGIGKLKVTSYEDFQDVAGMVAVADSYATTEPFIDAKFDIHIQKIASKYKAFIRKSISGSWKANIGSAMLEQIEMNDRYRLWVDEVAKLFDGSDIVCVEAVQSKDGKEYIIDANDSAVLLMGDTQEEDRRLISECTIQKMSALLKPAASAAVPATAAAAAASQTPKIASQAASAMQSVKGFFRQSSLSSSESLQEPVTQPVQQQPQAPQQHTDSEEQLQDQQHGKMRQQPPRPPLPKQMSLDQSKVSRRQFSGHKPLSQHEPINQTVPITTAATAQQPLQQQPAQPVNPGKEEDGEDTMKNLRKTFAGIFGEM